MTHVSPAIHEHAAELLRERVTELEAIFREMEANRVKIVGANDALRAENARLRAALVLTQNAIKDGFIFQVRPDGESSREGRKHLAALLAAISAALAKVRP